MEALSSRPYEGSGDLRRIQQLMVDDADWTAWHIGDLAWAMREHGHLELSLYIHLYLAGPRVVGWTFVRGRGFIDLHLHPAHRHAEAYASMLATAEATIDATTRAGDPVTGYGVWFWEGDAALGEAARQRGYAREGDGLQVNRRSLEELPVARDLPAGWTTGAVDTEARLASRVVCHSAAFAPSTMTVATYRRAMASWPYRPELDRVVVDETGDVVAACTVWFDEANADGLLEPVATRPRDQRRGFGRAVCIDALSALRAAGARTAHVGCLAGSPACDTYAAIGFEPVGLISTWRREPQAAP